MRQAVTAHYEGLVEDLRDDGLEPPVTLDEYLTAATAGGIGPNVFGELVVRTADGTWRQSYRSFCTQWIISVWGPGTDDWVLCPSDPTPWFPDSAFFDHHIYPPNHLAYYHDPRELVDDSDRASTYDRDGMEANRLAGEYLGVPPT